MSKLSHLSLALLPGLLFLAGCSHLQSPTKEQTLTSGGDHGANYNPGLTNSDFLPPSQLSSSESNNGPSRTDDLGSNMDWDHPRPEDILVTVHFAFDSYNIRSADRAALEAAAKKMAADPTIHAVAIGHTDWYGSEQYNLALSEKRADSVKAYVGKSGASAAMVEVLARGKYGAAPDVKKDSPEAQNDRRVDLVKVPAGAVLPTSTPTDANAPTATTATPAAGVAP